MSRNKYPEETVKLILDVATTLFIEKGYESTSLQDIIEGTKMSKGAIYHHFSSKEGIFEAICNRMGEENAHALAEIRDSKDRNGYQKLKEIFRAALCSANQNLMLTVTPNLLENPKFLSMLIKQIYEIVAPKFIKPILDEGIEDGSIQVENPEEVAEVIMLLNNIWLNPLVYAKGTESLKKRCMVYHRLLRGIGIDLFDEEMMNEYLERCGEK